ncbi:MAG: hypothetical protein R3C05_26135 [Pirellulaceae bacterium]
MKSDSELANRIRLILSDVDGVLTDGQIVFDGNGVETKAFHVRDGLGIKLWQRSGAAFGIVTARSSAIVRRRAEELGIELLRQGAENKWSAAESLMRAAGCTAEETCYIGDDLPDLAVMQRVAAAGLCCRCRDECSTRGHLDNTTAGGKGAVRELVERLLNAQDKWESLVNPR